VSGRGEATDETSSPAAIRAALEAVVDRLAGGGDEVGVHALRAALEAWRREQAHRAAWDAERSGLGEEIGNASLGIRGNASLVLKGPAGELPGVRERLEVVIRESVRIQKAARRLGELAHREIPAAATSDAA